MIDAKVAKWLTTHCRWCREYDAVQDLHWCNDKITYLNFCRTAKLKTSWPLKEEITKSRERYESLLKWDAENSPGYQEEQ